MAPKETQWAPMQKTIYSLPALRELLEAANRRYLEFLYTIEDLCNGRDKLSQSIANQGRLYPGFNLFDADDDALFQAILGGEVNISGLQNKSLRPFLPHLNSGQVSRLLKRHRLHGLIKKVARGYKYYVTMFGKDVLAAGLKFRELLIIPQLAFGCVA